MEKQQMIHNYWKNIENFIKKVLKFILEKILKLSLSPEKYDVMMQFIRFGIVGVSNTIVFYLIFLLTLLGLQHLCMFSSTDYLIAQFVGFVLSVLWSFYWNSRFVFTEKNGRNWFHALCKTYMSYAFTGLFLNTILSLLWVEIFHWPKVLAPVMNLFISVPLNFILNKFWAFESYE